MLNQVNMKTIINNEKKLLEIIKRFDSFEKEMKKSKSINKDGNE